MPVAGYLGWVVPQQSRQPSLAVSFIDGLLTPNTTAFLEAQGLVPAYRTGAPKHRGQALPWIGTQEVPSPGATAEAVDTPPSWQADYLRALDTARPGIYLDAAPVANLNATMEANVQLLLQGYEGPQFLVTSLQKVYTSRGNSSSSARIDGEF